MGVLQAQAPLGKCPRMYTLGSHRKSPITSRGQSQGYVSVARVCGGFWAATFSLIPKTCLQGVVAEGVSCKGRSPKSSCQGLHWWSLPRRASQSYSGVRGVVGLGLGCLGF
ncbi:unnamed protein product [Symbiodinium natans]|uniref:Uncharacterized protein n=1 Tax=Symbiodinium natans TaxID=878477 RepID=A0A812NN62_9DINO|nr:unnamed protein product [Symbiodinium natans]